MAILLGITGFKNTGKSEIRKYLVQTYGFAFRPMAEPIKNMLQVGLGLTDEEVSGPLKDLPCEALLGATPRLAMETLYVEWGRMMIHDDLWFFHWRKKVDAEGRNTVADDVRAPAAAATIRKSNGKIIRVVREGRLGSSSRSEQEMESITPDYTITNNGNIADLRKAVDTAMRSLGYTR